MKNPQNILSQQVLTKLLNYWKQTGKLWHPGHIRIIDLVIYFLTNDPAEQNALKVSIHSIFFYLKNNEPDESPFFYEKLPPFKFKQTFFEDPGDIKTQLAEHFKKSSHLEAKPQGKPQ